MDTDADIYWHVLDDDDVAWQWSRVLYAYVHPRRPEILYIGKADGLRSTVRSRWNGADKLDGFWRDLRRERRIVEHRVMVGDLALRPDARLTRQFLEDVERLLIFHVQPWGNLRSTESPPPRPGLRVRCRGRAWPGRSSFSC
jgi:hypothetical protein